MKLRINPEHLPRYQAMVMVAVVLVSIFSFSGVMLLRSWLESGERLNNIGQTVERQQQQLLETESQDVVQQITRLRDEARLRLKARVQDHTNQAWTVIERLYQRFNGQMPEAELQALARETLRDMRFLNGRGYIFIDDLQGDIVLNPLHPSLEGVYGLDVRDDRGVSSTAVVLAAVDNALQQGFTSYRWYPPGEDQMREKISFVRLFEPWGWVIGSGDYQHSIEADLRQMLLNQLRHQPLGLHGYFMVLDQRGQILTTGGDTERGLLSEERRNVLTGRLLNQASVGGGVLRVELWPEELMGADNQALVRVTPVPEWNWVLVAVMYPEALRSLVAEQQQSFQQSQMDDLKWLMIAALAGGGVTLCIALLFARLLRYGIAGYQRDLQAQQNRLELSARVFEASSEGMLISGPDNRIMAVNEAFCRITGYTRDEVVGQNPAFMASGTHEPEFYTQLWRQLLATDRWQGEVWNRRKDQSLFPEWLTISVYRDEAGQIQNFIGTLTDLSEHKRTEQRLRYLAEHDPLTDLPNRFLLADRVDQAVIQLRRYGGQLALLYLDLNRFRDVNETLGHAGGDQILREIAQRLSGQIRVSDTVARLGGDEFAVLMVKPEKPEQIATLASRLLEVVAQPLATAAGELIVTPSIGIAVCPDDGADFQSLLRHAETALRHARQEGRNSYRFFTSQMNDQVSSRLQLESDLRRAIQAKAFELHYQPQYNLRSNELMGCEALIRWQHSDRGFVSPLEFIPVAEESGLIAEIGHWVLEEACNQGAEWIAQGYAPTSIAVNISPRQFTADLPRLVAHVLATTGFPARLLVIEVTESLLIEDVERAERGLQALRQMGVRIALDDFGTGYSSLSYLKRFSLDKLKIDQSFIAGIPQDADDSALTSSILSIAHQLKLATVAEGVETAEQRAFLQAAGCDMGQGYFYAKPKPASQFERLLKESEPATLDA